jgi:hypothetical protein
MTLPNAGAGGASCSTGLGTVKEARVLSARKEQDPAGERVVLDQPSDAGDHFVDAEQCGWRRCDVFEFARLQRAEHRLGGDGVRADAVDTYAIDGAERAVVKRITPAFATAYSTP